MASWHQGFPRHGTALGSAEVGYVTISRNWHVVCCRCLRMTTMSEQQCAQDTRDIHVVLSKRMPCRYPVQFI